MKVLLFKPDHLGDFALSLPVLWELVTFLENTENLYVLAHPVNVEWSRLLPWLPKVEAIRYPRYDWSISRFLLYRELFFQMIRYRTEKFDWGFNLMAAKNDRWGNPLLRLSGCCQLGDRKEAHAVSDTTQVHESHRLATYFPKNWSITGRTNPADFMPAKLRWKAGIKILLAPAVRTPAKAWPTSYWLKLKAALPPDRTFILVPEDQASYIDSWWDQPDFRLRVKTVAETLGYLGESAVVIALDTAVAHYAWLVGTPIVQIFSGTSEVKRWGSLAQGKILSRHPSCSPCKLETCAQSQHHCMEDISVENVLAAVEEVLKSQS